MLALKKKKVNMKRLFLLKKVSKKKKQERGLFCPN